MEGCEVKVEFHLMELPNDMKMLAFLAGKLTNALHYFSTFANVKKSEATTIKYDFGIEPDKHHWSPFQYTKRVDDATNVAARKKVLDKKDTLPATKRSNLTKYIAQDLQSRQEEVPLVGEYVSFAKCEPLHLKNNTVKEMFMKVFKICVSDPVNSLKKYKSYSQIPTNLVFVNFVTFVINSMGCNGLAKKIIQWFNESSSKDEREFTFRFRGKESFSYLKHFRKSPELKSG